MNATVYYEQLLHDLQDHYGVQTTKLDAQQLEGTYVATEYLLTHKAFSVAFFIDNWIIYSFLSRIRDHKPKSWYTVAKRGLSEVFHLPWGRW